MDSYRADDGTVYWFDPMTQEWYKESMDALIPCDNPIPYEG